MRERERERERERKQKKYKRCREERKRRKGSSRRDSNRTLTTKRGSRMEKKVESVMNERESQTYL